MIFSLFNKKPKQPSLELKVDIHSHLIPAIDDGSRSMAESLKLLRGMEQLGYEKVITTPHIMADTYINTPKIIKDGLDLLKIEAKKENINIEIECGAEYYLDDGFSDILRKGDLLTIGDKYILFETSYYARPIHLKDMIFEMLSLGYTPIMAHPERYRYIKEKKEYFKFKELGVMFQVNINSFAGQYGKDAKVKANYLNKNGCIDFLGSDIHNYKQVERLELVMKSNVYKSIFKNNNIKNNDF